MLNKTKAGGDAYTPASHLNHLAQTIVTKNTKPRSNKQKFDIRC
jgi:hypothetical protein